MSMRESGVRERWSSTRLRAVGAPRYSVMAMTERRATSIILGAGRGSRLGGPKSLLAWPRSGSPAIGTGRKHVPSPLKGAPTTSGPGWGDPARDRARRGAPRGGVRSVQAVVVRRCL